MRRFTLGEEIARGSRENRHGTRVVRRARRARKRARRYGALLNISRDCRSHPRSPPLVCHPTNSLSAARERSQVRVRRAYTLSRAPRSSRARKIIIILTVRAASPLTISSFLSFLNIRQRYRLSKSSLQREQNDTTFIHCVNEYGYTRVTHWQFKVCVIRDNITLVVLKKDSVSLFLHVLSAPILRRCSYARRKQHLVLKPERGCRTEELCENSHIN